MQFELDEESRECFNFDEGVFCVHVRELSMFGETSQESWDHQFGSW